VRQVLRPGGEGKKVWLVADPGAAPQDDPGFDQASGQPDNPFLIDELEPTSREGRFLFQVKPTVPFELPNGDTERDLGKWLLKRGLARPVPTTSITAGGENRAAALKRIYRKARNKAGQPSAKGIWHAFDKSTWEAKNDLAP
jgi:endonuclease YncB( thermonuclease family)